jgi:hypothetical protein
MLATRASHKAAPLARVGASIRHSNRPLLASSFPSTASSPCSSLPAHHTPHEEKHHTHPYRHGAGWIRRHYFSSSSFLGASRPTLYTMGEVRPPLSLPSPALNQTTSLLLRRTNVATPTDNQPAFSPFPTPSCPFPYSIPPSPRPLPPSFFPPIKQGYLGSLGHGDFQSKPSLTPLASLAPFQIQDFASGWAHSAVLTTCGQLFLFGRPHDVRKALSLRHMWQTFPILVRINQAMKRVFDNPAADASTYLREDVLLLPRAFPLPRGERPLKVACSGALTAIITENGRVYCMGHNAYGQCGLGGAVLVAAAEEEGGREGGGGKGPSRIVEMLAVSGPLEEEVEEELRQQQQQ